MSERSNPGPLPDLHAALAVLEDTPTTVGGPRRIAPAWPAANPNMTPAAHASRVRLLALLLGLTEGADLPQIRGWLLDADSPRHGGGPVIHAQLAHLDDDQLVHDAVVAWAKVLPGGFTWVELWEQGTTMVAARCFFDGVLVEVWTTLHDRITGTPAVTPTPGVPSRPTSLAASASWVDPLTDAQAYPRAPLASVTASVAPVEQLLQEV